MKGKITVEKRSFRKMAEVEFVGEVPSRKRKGGSHTDKNKKKKREPTIEILESPIAPVEVQSPAEDETAAAVQELLNELSQIRVEVYSTPWKTWLLLRSTTKALKKKRISLMKSLIKRRMKCLSMSVSRRQ